jgi:hypothetical protein
MFRKKTAVLTGSGMGTPLSDALERMQDGGGLTHDLAVVELSYGMLFLGLS